MGIYAERDETVTAGQTVATIANPAVRQAVVDIGEDMIDVIQTGTRFRIELQKSDDVKTIGEVREISPQADPKTRTRRVRITLKDQPEGFRLGSTILANPIAVSRGNIRVPVTAVFDQQGENRVWVVEEATGTVRSTPVGVARRGERTVDIKSGIAPGDRVVIAGARSLTQGQRVLWDRDLKMNSAVITNPVVTSPSGENE